MKGEAHCWVGFYVAPATSMHAALVYRPSTNTIYQRYHVLHDCNVVYGDFMGAMYAQRVKGDRLQREYFNNELRKLYVADVTKNSVVELLRKLPWAYQPMPETAKLPLTSPIPIPATPILSPDARSPIPIPNIPPTPHTEALPPPSTPLSPSPARVATRALPTPQQAVTTLPVRPARTVGGRRQSSAAKATPAKRLRMSSEPQAAAKQMLEGLVPRNRSRSVIELVLAFADLTYSCLELSTWNPESHDATIWPVYDEQIIESDKHLVFLQLCEATARRIARTKEPKTYRQINKLTGVEGQLVRDAMLEELMWMISKGKVIPRDKSSMPRLHELEGKWVVKYKKKLDGLLDRVRARYVLRGDLQQAHVDYDPNSIHSPVATRSATLTAFALATQFGLVLYELDVAKAFTVSGIDRKDLYIKVPRGADLNNPDLCPFGADTTWELRTTLYGLRQASAMYYKTFTNIILSYVDKNGQRYRRSDAVPCVFTKGELGTSSYITFSVHIDDSFIAAANVALVDEMHEVLKAANFECTVKPMTAALGMRVSYIRWDGTQGGILVLDHDQYIRDAHRDMSAELKRHAPDVQVGKRRIPMSIGVSKAKRDPDEPPLLGSQYKLFRNILGRVSHVANTTHPEICTAISFVSQNMAKPTKVDLQNVVSILCYLFTCVCDDKVNLTMRRDPNFVLSQDVASCPVTMACDADLGDCRSRTGYLVLLFGNVMAWCSRKQKSVALSVAESEYVAMSNAAQFGIWYTSLLSDMGLEVAIYKPFVLYSDSQSAIHIATSEVEVVHKYSKHISRRVHWFRELLRCTPAKMEVRFIKGEHNVADILTKCLSRDMFRNFRNQLLDGGLFLSRLASYVTYHKPEDISGFFTRMLRLE